MTATVFYKTTPGATLDPKKLKETPKHLLTTISITLENKNTSLMTAIMKT